MLRATLRLFTFTVLTLSSVSALWVPALLADPPSLIRPVSAELPAVAESDVAATPLTAIPTTAIPTTALPTTALPAPGDVEGGEFEDLYDLLLEDNLTVERRDDGTSISERENSAAANSLRFRGEDNQPATTNGPSDLQLDPTAQLPAQLPGPAQLPSPAGDSAEPAPAQRQHTPQMIALRNDIRRVLQYHYVRPESSSYRSPWGIMHCMIAYGADTRLFVGNRTMNAVSYLCWNGTGRNLRLFYTENGELRTREGPGVQGHEGQFLAMLAQSRIDRKTPMQVDGQKFTVEDLIDYEMSTCKPNSELTFKLIGLSYYLDSSATWTTADGENWTIARLIQEELKQPIVGAACGGTHRLMGFSFALRQRSKRGEPIDGQWLRARNYIDSYHAYTMRLRNRDGSFSTSWFEGRGFDSDLDRRLQTSGHILEWMIYSLPEERLEDPRIVASVRYLTTLMLRNLRHDWEVGPRGHALRALVNYDERVFGGGSKQHTWRVSEVEKIRFIPPSPDDEEDDAEGQEEGGRKMFRFRRR